MHATLDEFVSDTCYKSGVALGSLAPGTVLDVQTRNSTYHMVVLDGADRRVLISGGRVFPKATEAKIAGATGGGTAVKIGWIGEGLRLEFSTDHGRVTTSPVDSIEVEDEADAA